ncbi:MFS transporter [Phenylobacterium sp. 20VBR1]|uniref:MFS transporter n=1 Tax=Phenylobacterium glaciei TaxID=2803784 RepID=A0A941D1T3_9CAUL|nr:MFS transporter [Phenylobacterium glaciei]MBR7620367.1 MFS transporter [Phenylobacterium glaciei]
MNGSKPRDVFRLPGFLAFWTAETVSEFGSYVTTLALQVLVVLTLHGSATQVGLLNASRWLPYLVLGLILGALVDRWRRKPILVATDLGRALLLGVIPGLWLLGWLSLPILMVFVALFGVLTLLNDAASQSFVPRLVSAPDLLAANARLDQGAATAQTSGPVVAGALVTALGAPLAVLVDAASYLISALVVWRIPVEEPVRAKSPVPLNLRREIGEGLAYVYRHPRLAPFAWGTHGWFLFNSMLTTVFTPFVLLELELTAFQLGIALAAAGGAGLLGSLAAARIGRAWGAGGAVIACRALMPLAWAVIALAPGAGSPWTLVALAVGQGLYGLAMGASNANEMGYRQAVTPDALQGRMNTTMRSLNRGMIVVGAPAGGWLADTLGYRPTLWIAIAGFVAVMLFLAASPFRHARHGDTA